MRNEASPWIEDRGAQKHWLVAYLQLAPVVWLASCGTKQAPPTTCSPSSCQSWVGGGRHWQWRAMAKALLPPRSMAPRHRTKAHQHTLQEGLCV
jgi:hypothetical protein